MVIGIDAHSLNSQQCGNETYTYNLVTSLSGIDTSNQYFVFVSDKNILNNNGLANTGNFCISLLPLRNKWLRMPVALGVETFRKKIDVLHTQYFIPPFYKGKIVVTVHDICFKTFPQYFSRSDMFSFKLFELRIKKADRIIVVSNFIKDELMQKMGVDSQKIDVIYNGVNGTFRPIENKKAISKIESKYGIKSKFILYVGRINLRKNLDSLIMAYGLIRRKMGAEYKLVIAGKHDFGKGIIYNTARKLNLEKEVIITGYVPMEDLPLLYNGAKVFVYPSFYEGFGLPVVEAMACGTPVVTSNTPVFSEISGGAAIMIDPYNVKQLAEATIRLLTRSDIWKEFSEAGLRRASIFSWEKTAELTLKSYNKVMGVN